MSLGTVPAISFGLYSKFFQAIWIIPRVRNQQKLNQAGIGVYFAPQVTWDLAENIPPACAESSWKARGQSWNLRGQQQQLCFSGHDDNPLFFFGGWLNFQRNHDKSWQIPKSQCRTICLSAFLCKRKLTTYVQIRWDTVSPSRSQSSPEPRFRHLDAPQHRSQGHHIALLRRGGDGRDQLQGISPCRAQGRPGKRTWWCCPLNCLNCSNCLPFILVILV